MNPSLGLDRTSVIPLQDQLFAQLRQLIINRILKPKSRLIATRFLAEQIGVSRTTVLLAYERLISEGYLETRPAVGTFVRSILPDQPKPISVPLLPSHIARHASLHPSVFDFQLSATSTFSADLIDFGKSRFDPNYLVSARVLLNGMRKYFTREPECLAERHPAAGVPALRRAIADRLAATRGIVASPDQVMIVSGCRQACNLVAHLFQVRDDNVVMEAPGDLDVISLFKARGAHLVHVPVDEYGLKTERLPQEPVSLAYVTSACQNPLGGTLPQSRRKQLIDWARGVGAYLIEDESDAELRYHGLLLSSLAALDPYGLVFYIGSFARTLGPALGLSYLIIPLEFVNAITALKNMTDDGCSWLSQMVVADLLTNGEYEHHLRRVRKVAMERRDCLIRELRIHFGDVRLLGAEIGTQLTWLLPKHLPSGSLVCDKANAHGAKIECVNSDHAEACPYNNKALVFNYAGLTTVQIRQGIARVAEALDS